MRFDFIILDFEVNFENFVLLKEFFSNSTRFIIDFEKNKVKIKGKSETYNVGALQNQGYKKHLGPPGYKIFINVVNTLNLKKVFLVISVGRKSKFKEWDKRRKVE